MAHPSTSCSSVCRNGKAKAAIAHCYTPSHPPVHFIQLIPFWYKQHVHSKALTLIKSSRIFISLTIKSACSVCSTDARKVYLNDSCGLKEKRLPVRPPVHFFSRVHHSWGALELKLPAVKLLNTNSSLSEAFNQTSGESRLEAPIPARWMCLHFWAQNTDLQRQPCPTPGKIFIFIWNSIQDSLINPFPLLVFHRKGSLNTEVTLTFSSVVLASEFPDSVLWSGISDSATDAEQRSASQWWLSCPGQITMETQAAIPSFGLKSAINSVSFYLFSSWIDLDSV